MGLDLTSQEAGGHRQGGNPGCLTLTPAADRSVLCVSRALLAPSNLFPT